MLPHGFRIVGTTHGSRQAVDAAAALAAYASCDERAEVEKEAYLSAFQYGDDFLDFLDETGSTRHFAGVCWAPWLWFDVDRADDLTRALKDTRKLAAHLIHHFGLNETDLSLYYSGSKGFHIGLPTLLWSPEPSVVFNRVARSFCRSLAERAEVAIDTSVYDKVRAFRAPNSRHPKTGLHKRPLTFDELLKLKLNTIVDMARTPLPVDVPTTIAKTSKQALTDWPKASAAVAEETTAITARSASSNGRTTLNRLTLEFIQSGASEGERAVRLFSAAANLAELGCSFELAYALLSESALDSGLPPKEVRRQIEAGLNHQNGK